MGLHKNEGDPHIALMEECAEVIQVISKMMRFNDNLNSYRPGAVLNRFEEIEKEMEDVLYQWERLKKWKEDYDNYMESLASQD